MVWRAVSLTPGVHGVFFSLLTLYEQYLGFPPVFSLRETWGDHEACPNR